MSHYNSIKKVIIPKNLSMNSMGIYEDWSANNIRSLLIFDEFVLIRYYGPTKYNQYNLVKYSIEPPSEDSDTEESVIGLVEWKTQMQNSRNYQNERLDGLEDFVVFSKNRSLLKKEIYQCKNNKALINFDIPCLRDIGFYYVEQDFDVEETIDSIIEFFNSSKIITEVPLIEFCKSLKCEEVFAVEGNDFSWYKNFPNENNRVLKPYLYALDSDEGHIAITLDRINYAASSILESRVNRRLNADMKKYGVELKQLNDMVEKWNKSFINILKCRIGMEQALAYGYYKLLEEKSVRTDLEKRFILNHYYTDTIYYEVNSLCSGNIMRLYCLKPSEYAYISELAKRTGNNDLYEFIKRLPCIKNYLCKEYKWENYLTPDVAFNYSETKDLTLEDYSEMVLEKVYDMYSYLQPSRFKGDVSNNLTDLFIELNTPKEYNETIPDKEPDIRTNIDFLSNLMNEIIEEEFVSCCKMYFEVLPLWKTDYLSNNMAAIAEEIKNGTDIDFTDPGLCIDDGDKEILYRLIASPNLSHMPIMRSYNDNIGLFHKKHLFDKYNIISYFENKNYFGKTKNRNFVLTTPEKVQKINCRQIKIIENEIRNKTFGDYKQMSELICSLYRTLFKRFKVFDERMPEVLKYEESLDNINKETMYCYELDELFQ